MKKNENIDNIILKYNFLISNLYFFIKNTNIIFYINIIGKFEKIRISKKYEEILLIKQSLKEIDFFNELNNQLDSTIKEFKKFEEIFMDLHYDLTNRDDILKNHAGTTKYENLIIDLKNNIENLSLIIESLEKAKNFDYEKLFTIENINYLIILSEIKKNLNLIKF